MLIWIQWPEFFRGARKVLAEYPTREKYAWRYDLSGERRDGALSADATAAYRVGVDQRGPGQEDRLSALRRADF